MATQRDTQRERTRQRLITVARQLFAEHGYAATSTGAILAQADLARGALYHHFTDKRDLFQAAFEAVEADLVERVTTAAYADPEQPLWERVVAGVEEFLAAAAEPEVQRIVLTDAPAVLGTRAWRELDERYGLALVKRVLEQAIHEGLINPRPIDPLARLLLAAFNEAATTIALADDPDATRDDMTTAVITMLNDLRTP